MCSLNDVDGNFENLVLSEKQSFREGTNCRSCTERGWVVLRKKDVYCKNCFLIAATHKFRGALGKSKMMKPQDKVLFAYSGSQSSAALLHLLQTGVTEDQHKKLMFSICVLFIDEGALFDNTVEERQKRINRVKDELSHYNFPLYVCNLSESLKESISLESSLKICEKYEKQLIDFFQSVKTMSSKEDLLYVLRQKLILRAAEELKCNKVFTAEVGTDLAVKLLGQFSLGRGDQASFETRDEAVKTACRENPAHFELCEQLMGFCDSRHPNIKILRPLRDFTRKEIVFYNKFQNVEGINGPALTTKSPHNISIQKLTEKFVSDLQENFPSTVYTIFRTGEKLSAATSEERNDKMCLLCKDNLRTHKSRSNYTAIEAADFSRNVSRKKINNCMKANKSCGFCSREERADIDSLELEKFLCYGCTSIARDMKNLDFLPNDAVQSVIHRKKLETMKEQISDFLIENSSELEV